MSRYAWNEQDTANAHVLAWILGAGLVMEYGVWWL